MKKECLVFYLQVEAVEPSEGRLLLFSYANLCFNQPKEAIYIYHSLFTQVQFRRLEIVKL